VLCANFPYGVTWTMIYLHAIDDLQQSEKRRPYSGVEIEELSQVFSSLMKCFAFHSYQPKKLESMANPRLKKFSMESNDKCN